MITDWTSADGLRATEMMGPIEFPLPERNTGTTRSIRMLPNEYPEPTDPRHWRLVMGYYRKSKWVEAGGCSSDVIPDAVALAILRDHARERLEKRDIFIEIGRDNGDIDRMLFQAVGSGTNYTNRPLTLWLQSYDNALIDAILAAGE